MIYFLRTFLAFLLVFFAFSPATKAESLREALAKAYMQNPQLNGARAETDQAAEGVAQAYSNYRPQITAGGQYNFTSTKTENSTGNFSTEANKPYGYSVELSQNLFSGFSRLHQVRSANYLLDASSANLVSAEQDTLFATIQSYLAVLRAKDLVKIRRQNLEFLQEQTKASRARLEVGDATITDVSQSQAQLALAQAQLSGAISSQEIAKAQYKLIIGNEAENLSWPNLLSESPNVSLPESLQAAEQRALSSHPFLLAAINRLSSSEAQESALKSLFLPSLNLTATSTKSYPDGRQFSNRSVETSNLVLGVRVPLYRGGGEYSALRSQKANVSQRKFEVDQARLQLHTIVVGAWSRLESARANYTAAVEQLESVKLALDGVIKERDVGRRTQLDILDAQNAVLLAEELLINSRLNRIVAEYEVLASMGDLTATSLALNVELFSHGQPRNFFGIKQGK